MFQGNRLHRKVQSSIQVIITASVLLILFCSALFPLLAYAQREPEGPEEPRDSYEEVIDITADEVRYDRRAGLAIASGNVAVLFKSFRITGNYAEYDEDRTIVAIRGGAKFEDTLEGSVFLADKIEFLLEKEEMEAEGGVSLRYKGGEVLAYGDKLSYFSVDKRAVVQGDACVEIKGKVFQAKVITIFLDEERVVAEGGTRTVIPRDE
jgi:lipopolysaccharide export system protein LptA